MKKLFVSLTAGLALQLFATSLLADAEDKTYSKKGKVRKPYVTLYEDCNYSGGTAIYHVGRHISVEKFSSFKLYNNAGIFLHTDSDNPEAGKRFVTNVKCLTGENTLGSGTFSVFNRFELLEERLAFLENRLTFLEAKHEREASAFRASIKRLTMKPLKVRISKWHYSRYSAEPREDKRTLFVALKLHDVIQALGLDKNDKGDLLYGIIGAIRNYKGFEFNGVEYKHESVLPPFSYWDSPEFFKSRSIVELLDEDRLHRSDEQIRLVVCCVDRPENLQPGNSITLK